MTETIQLTASEILLGAMVGVMRQCQNIRLKRQQANEHNPAEDWQHHINGALGELAVAKWRGMFWMGSLGMMHAKDVGRLQVRTASEPRHRLILHRKDADEDPFVLARGLNGKYEIVGWCYAREGKLQENWEDPKGHRPAYFVKPEQLRDIDTLEAALAEGE